MMAGNSPNSNVPYLVAIVAMALIGASTIAVIYAIRPEGDNTLLVTTVVGMIAPTTMALLAFLKAQETHITVNSRMDEFKRVLEESAAARAEIARVSAHEEGVQIGRELANARTDALSVGTAASVDAAAAAVKDAANAAALLVKSTLPPPSTPLTEAEKKKR